MMFEPASELLRQGNKFARDEQFSDADRVFRAAVMMPKGEQSNAPLMTMPTPAECFTVPQSLDGDVLRNRLRLRLRLTHFVFIGIRK